ncbi:MAG TPA: cupin domain-containing protein [bacterium]|nr:cupin domain-containing protein [bacterium]
MRADDGLLQPPRIRHRVLECSDQLEVRETAVPAEHQTAFDHQLALPTAAIAPDRDFGGQRFHLYRAHEHEGTQIDIDDLGFGPATNDLAEVRTVNGGRIDTPTRTDNRLLFAFVLRGSCRVHLADQEHALQRGAAVTIPAGQTHAFTDASPDCRLLRVRLRQPV